MLENRDGVLLLSVMPEAHVMLLQAFRNRGIPASFAISGSMAQRRLSARPVLVIVDLVYGAALDRLSIARINALRGSSTVLALHDGDLGRFASELDELVVDGFCRTGEWYPLVEMAAETLHHVSEARRS
jgi:hypothetical protein